MPGAGYVGGFEFAVLSYVDDRSRVDLVRREQSVVAQVSAVGGPPGHTARDWNGVELFEDRVIPYLAEFSATMHRYDVPVVCQITHRGRRGRSIDLWNRLYGPSDTREPNHRENPHPIEPAMMDEIIASFAAAAGRT